MIEVLPAPAVVASASNASRIANDLEEFVYELLPSEPLPKLDLLLSIKSRFLSRRALLRLNSFVQRRREIGIAAFFGTICYALALLTPVGIGRVTAILSALLYGPNVIAALSMLRFDMVCVLLGAYDFWFSSFVSASTFVGLGVVIGDIRAIAIIFAWLGIQLNILIDANVHAVKLWVVFNALGTVNFVVTWLAVSLDLIDQMQHRSLVQVKTQELTVKGGVVTGLITVVALIVRNVYRKRHAMYKNANSSMIECVSYRTNLKYVSKCHIRSAVRVVTPASGHDTSDPEYVKTMRYIKQMGSIDATDTLLQTLWVKSALIPSRFGIIFHWLGILSALATIVSSSIGAFGTGDLTSSYQVSETVAFVLTCVYCSAFALHCQRKVLRALCTSFDFVFLSVQLTVVQVSLCDFLHWRLSGSLSILTWWIWIHWVLMLDAVTPVIREKLGLKKHFAVSILLVFLCAHVTLIWKLVVTNDMLEIYSRVLWRGEIFGCQNVEVRLLPLLCNCLGTVILLCIRLTWRLVSNDFGVLLVLDGAVAYEIYLENGKRRRSRRWGSIIVPSQPISRSTVPKADALFTVMKKIRPS